jgi:AraC-like DNA-binding protein
MSSTVSVRYSFPDPRLFEFMPAMGEINIAPGGEALDLIPPDMASISVTLSGQWFHGMDAGSLEPSGATAMLHGPTSRARWYHGVDGAGFMIALHPLAWPVLLGHKASDFADKSVPLATVLEGAEVAFITALSAADRFEARIAAANAFFLSLRRCPVKPELAATIMAFRQALADPDCASVDELAMRVGLPQTRLARLARSCFGFPPKLLIQRERFRRMLHRADAHSYAEWRAFIEGQYVDQSHMIRDFRRFLGLSPSRYFALDRPIVGAAFAEARRLLGLTPLDAAVSIAAE